MIADDLYYSQYRYGEHHAGNTPHQFANNDDNYRRQWIDVYFGANYQRFQNVRLQKLYYCISNDDANDHIHAATLRQNHQNGERISGEVPDKRHYFQHTAQYREEDRV